MKKPCEVCGKKRILNEENICPPCYWILGASIKKMESDEPLPPIEDEPVEEDID